MLPLVPDSTVAIAATSLDGLFTAISALAALGSTIAAFLTVRASREANKEARQVRVVERNAGYYKLFVLDPGVPAVHAFTQAASSIVSKGISELNAIPTTAKQADVLARTQRIVEAFVRVRSTLTRDLYYATAAWSDESLWQTISPMVRSLEDETVSEIANLVAPAARQEAIIIEAIQRRSARILAALADYDLQTHSFSSAPR